MSSLYDDLSEKLKKDPRLTRRGGARYDLSLLLFNARDSLHELWEAADRYIRSRDSEAFGDLQDAVEKLRPVFVERGASRERAHERRGTEAARRSMVG